MQYQDILDFWFKEVEFKQKFQKSDEFDQLIKSRFLETYEQALQGQYDEWKHSAKGILAMVILFDQFPRNMFRGEGKAFATDQLALHLAKHAVANHYDQNMDENEKMFLYMPFMHSEDMADQDMSLKLFAPFPLSFDYAVAHKDIIERFGRFPHRNEALSRESTAAEIEFMNENSGF